MATLYRRTLGGTICHRGYSMNGKTIWYCHPYAGSPQEGMSYRPYYLAKYWKKAGHHAFVISSSFHHLLHHPKEQKDTIVQQEIEGVDYIRLKTPIYHHNSFKRILNMLSFAWQTQKNEKKLLEITGKPDVIIASSSHPFHYISLYRIAKKHQIPLIFEVRDLWPSSLIELLKLKPWHPLVILLAIIEKHAYKYADKVISLLENAQPYMVSKGLNPEKFIYIPNGTDCEIQDEKNLPQALDRTIHELKKQKKFLIGYAGALGVPNAMEYFIQAMGIVQKSHPHLHALLIGHGQQKTTLMDYCKENHMHNVSFFEPIPKTQVHYFLKEMDLLYLGWQDSPLYQNGVSPNKLFDYMLAGRPILESGGTSDSLINKAKCGKNCVAADSHHIADALIEISQTNHEIRLEQGRAARKHVLKHHDYQMLSQQYSNIFDSN